MPCVASIVVSMITALIIRAAKSYMETARTSITSSLVRFSLSPAGKALEGFDREAVRKVLTSADYINGAQERGLIMVDADAKGSPITLVA